MALKDLLEISSRKDKKIGISEERVMSTLKHVGPTISFWRAYPDKFVDFLVGPNGKFKLFFYQRIFLRAVMRNRYSFMTFPRA